jgi:hypothetical protein
LSLQLTKTNFHVFHIDKKKENFHIEYNKNNKTKLKKIKQLSFFICYNNEIYLGNINNTGQEGDTSAFNCFHNDRV